MLNSTYKDLKQFLIHERSMDFYGNRITELARRLALRPPKEATVSDLPDPTRTSLVIAHPSNRLAKYTRDSYIDYISFTI